jgi:hypothetical protein
MAKTLKRFRIENLTFLSVEVVEYVDGITDFVEVFCHPELPQSLTAT